MRAHGQGDVPVPGAVLPDLVVIERGLILGGLEAFLDRPPCPGHLDRAGEAGRAGRPAQVIGELAATQRECLELLGCYGAGKVRKLAEIAAATVLCGELSLGWAILTEEWVTAHDRLGRNRP